MFDVFVVLLVFLNVYLVCVLIVVFWFVLWFLVCLDFEFCIVKLVGYFVLM